ncbi:MAG: hypothetical protein JWN81_372 [Solirubrobacterales bacterium]|nr:hypothetical protein [Solirubrobacterales bacterium]
MELGVYTVDTWGARVGTGATDPQYCTLNGVAKVAPAGAKAYLVANEHICARLASIINLPVPPGVIVEAASGEFGYVVLRFGNANERPPRLIPTDLTTDHPGIAAGILAFDCWIANGDRHEENVAYSPGIWPPMAFDHSHAFFGDPGDPGRLADHSMLAAVGMLSQHITDDPAPFQEWIERVQSIRPGVIDEVLESLVARSIIDAGEASVATSFLTARQATLPDLLKASLPGVNWS